MDFWNTIMTEMTKGNFSFDILLVGAAQLLVMNVSLTISIILLSIQLKMMKQSKRIKAMENSIYEIYICGDRFAVAYDEETVHTIIKGIFEQYYAEPNLFIEIKSKRAYEK